MRTPYACRSRTEAALASRACATKHLSSSGFRKIEALFAGTTSDGEREAARLAAERIRARLAEWRKLEGDVVMSYSLPDPWKRKLFLALCRRYELKPYREYRQRYSTVMLRAPKAFHSNTLWPEVEALADELDKDLSALTDRIVRAAIHADVSEAVEGEPKLLSAGEESD